MPSYTIAPEEPLRTVSVVPTVRSDGQESAHALEPELAGASIPRVARLKKSAVNRTRLLGNLLLVTMGMLCFFMQRDYQVCQALRTRGIETQAMVYDAHVSSVGGYIQEYSFPVQDGEIYSSRNINTETYNSTSLNAHIPITYLPTRPVTVWTVGTKRAPDYEGHNGMAKIVLGILGFGFATSLVSTYTSARRQWRFLREGIAVHGRVRSGEVIQQNMSIYRVHYTYWIGGGSRTGSMEVDASQYKAFTEHNPYFTVLYAAAQPSKHMPYKKIDAAYLVTANTL